MTTGRAGVMDGAFGATSGACSYVEVGDNGAVTAVATAILES